MSTAFSGLAAVILYATGTWFQLRSLRGDGHHRNIVIGLGFAALLAHLFNVYGAIYAGEGYNFGIFHVATLFCWTIVALVLLSSLRKPLENLFVVLYPMAILGIASALLFRNSGSTQSTYSTGVAVHIGLAIIATSVITISAVQAAILAFENRQLKQRHSLHLLNHMPALQTMENLLFEIVWAGLVLLTTVIISGVIFMDDMVAQHLRHKLAFSVIAWIVFAILVWGHHARGWRGRTAVRMTLTGFMFLVLAYFGSKFVLELILNRA